MQQLDGGPPYQRTETTQFELKEKGGYIGGGGRKGVLMCCLEKKENLMIERQHERKGRRDQKKRGNPMLGRSLQ